MAICMDCKWDPCRCMASLPSFRKSLLEETLGFIQVLKQKIEINDYSVDELSEIYRELFTIHDSLKRRMLIANFK